MASMHKKCPVCHGEDTVDEKLVCKSCGSQLEYIDRQGSLGVKSTINRCSKCHTENSSSSLYCESCGSQLTRECPLCKGAHPVDALVCGKYGEPLEAPHAHSWKISTIISESFNLILSRHRKAFLVPLALMALILGYFGYMRLTSHTIVLIPSSQKPKVDVIFTVDSTGSMADEIQVVQEKIREMMSQIKSGQPVPEVRFGLVTYRDRGDDYVVKKFELTDDISKFQQYVNTLVADGGGDTKESVNEALHTAITDMNWDPASTTSKLIFLIGDAGPHNDYNNGLSYQDEAVNARKKGIKIYSLGCSGIEEDGEPEFREIAQATGGSFDFLTYRQKYVDDTGATYYRLKAGESYYTFDEKDGDGWKEGASVVEKKGSAVKTEAPAPAGAGGTVLLDGGINAKPDSALENNTDTAVLRKIQQELETQGVKYKK